MREYQIYPRGRRAHACPLAEKFSYLKRVLDLTEMYVEFQLIWRGPKFTLGGAAPPARSLAEIFSYLKRVLGPV